MDDMSSQEEVDPPSIPPAEDTAATAVFVRQHIGWMLRLARGYLPDGALAEDAVQNAFTQVFTKSDQFEGRSSIQSWIRRILVNEALMILRKRKSLREDPSIDPLLPEFDKYDCRIEAPWNRPQTPEQIAITNETREIVMDAIQQLPDDYRVILLLRDIEEQSTAEVSDTLGISTGNVKVRLHRARSALKALLETHMRNGRFER